MSILPGEGINVPMSPSHRALACATRSREGSVAVIASSPPCRAFSLDSCRGRSSPRSLYPLVCPECLVGRGGAWRGLALRDQARRRHRPGIFTRPRRVRFGARWPTPTCNAHRAPSAGPPVGLHAVALRPSPAPPPRTAAVWDPDVGPRRDARHKGGNCAADRARPRGFSRPASGGGRGRGRTPGALPIIEADDNPSLAGRRAPATQRARWRTATAVAGRGVEPGGARRPEREMGRSHAL